MPRPSPPSPLLSARFPAQLRVQGRCPRRAGSRPPADVEDGRRLVASAGPMCFSGTMKATYMRGSVPPQRLRCHRRRRIAAAKKARASAFTSAKAGGPSAYAASGPTTDARSRHRMRRVQTTPTSPARRSRSARPRPAASGPARLDRAVQCGARRRRLAATHLTRQQRQQRGAHRRSDHTKRQLLHAVGIVQHRHGAGRQ